MAAWGTLSVQDIAKHCTELGSKITPFYSLFELAGLASSV